MGHAASAIASDDREVDLHMRNGGAWAMTLVLGCGPVAGIPNEGGSAGGDGTSDGGGAEVSGGSDGDAGVARCGDGALVPPEICDDGDLAVGNGCNPDCRPSGLALWVVDLSASRDLSSEATRVAISPAPEIVVGVTHHVAANSEVELAGVDLLGTPSWRHPDASEFDNESLSALVVGDDGTQSIAVAAANANTSAFSVQSWANDGTLRSQVFPGLGNTYPAALAPLRDDELVVAAYDVIGGEAGFWLESITTLGSTTWRNDVAQQPIAMVGLVQGGAYVQYTATGDTAPIQRLGPDGIVVWQSSSGCAGPMDVDGEDTLTIVQTADPGLRVCRIAADASATELPLVDVGNAYPTALATTRSGDLLVGGYTLGPADPAPWLARISRPGVVQWVSRPAFDVGLVLSVDIDDELGIAVAAGFGLSDQVAFVAGFTP